MIVLPIPLARLLAMALIVLGFVGAASGDGGPKARRPGDPVVSIPLDDLGVEVPQPRLLLNGSTMFSLNFVDETHLLVTFHAHGLIPRLPDEPPDDDDRLVTALVVELPSGNVLARTRWHTHDREQYLWPLSHGLFLLRVRSRLTIIDPMRNLASGDPFHEQAFLDMKRRIGYIGSSPGGELLVVETVPPLKNDPEGAVATQAGGQSSVVTLEMSARPSTQIHLYRMLFAEPPGQPAKLVAQEAGILAAKSPMRVPATAEGFLDVSRESPMTWLFDFQSHGGKRLELAPFDTTCAPVPYFVSRSEFVAFGCHGADNKMSFSGFNFRGEQPWIQMLSGLQLAPLIVAAPSAGRFAFSRIVGGNSYLDGANIQPADLTSQEIQVLQSHDGRVLLKVQASPIQRTGQNFDMSPSGLGFTVIRGGNLEVYRLPELTAKDQAQLKLAAKDFPERNEARIRLKSTPGTKEAESAQTHGGLKGVASQPTEAVREMTAAPVGGLPAENLPPPQEPEAPRTPPSLYDSDHPRPLSH